MTGCGRCRWPWLGLSSTLTEFADARRYGFAKLTCGQAWRQLDTTVSSRSTP